MFSVAFVDNSIPTSIVQQTVMLEGTRERFNVAPHEEGDDVDNQVVIHAIPSTPYARDQMMQEESQPPNEFVSTSVLYFFYTIDPSSFALNIPTISRPFK